ncbi:hypothetical protein GUJ93_ZPchr0001g30541 [Zizania palustris]|uniref:Myb/SANT-like DNA-binding domain-containing protein n=1 Tax=Zizania palustris TaxID=103762 RepID=A0A8J5RZX1_ZIZPA|nr:hypothetical protein GUJ93_ZPchr0001g30541 [Zizania palustris]
MERGDGGGGGRGMVPRGVVGTAAMLGLEMHLAAHPQMHTAAFHQPDHHGGGAGAGGGFPQQHMAVRQQQPPSYSPYSAGTTSRGVKPGGNDEELGNGAGKGVGQQPQPGSAGCPWTRMKWTDGMVRLLIDVVHSVGDDGDGAVGGKPAAAHGKASSSGAQGGHGQAAAQQKKGKWKSVSRAMMEKGYMVSPQQCEDKFNDLNKRYKRVVDLLSRGKACKVVENHALLDAMDELTVQSKIEARKLLSSKHLFFREMCAYHNSANTAAAAAQASHGTAAGEATACFHHPPPASMAASSAARQAAPAAPSPVMNDDSAGTEDDDNSDDSSSSNEEDEDDDDGLLPGIMHRGDHIYGGPCIDHHHNGHHKRRRGSDDMSSAAAGDDEEEDGKRARALGEDEAPCAVRLLQSELEAAAAAAAGDPQQMRQWVRQRMVEVEEQQMAYECRAYHLERQELKWERFRANKEREMERARLRNDGLRIDGRRMLLLLRQKDLDFDISETNSSIDHRTSSAPPPPQPLAALQPQLDSSPSTGGHPN